MTLDKRWNTRLDQQIALWLQNQERQRQTERESELRPVVMEVVLSSEKPEAKTL